MPLPQQLATGTPQRLERTGPETRHEVLVVARPEMCEAGREEPFDELSAWIPGPTLTRHSHLMSTHRGFFMPGDPGTPKIPEIREAGEIRKTPVSSSKRQE